VAVPNDSPIQRIRDLRESAWRPKLVQFTRRYLKKKGVEAQVEFSWGANRGEGAAPGRRDRRTDGDGSSLRAKNLRIVETILESTTVLIANREAWKDPWKREKIGNIALLLQALSGRRRRSVSR